MPTNFAGWLHQRFVNGGTTVAALDLRVWATPVTVDGESITLKLSGRPVEEVPLTPIESLLNILTSPALAALSW